MYQILLLSSSVSTANTTCSAIVSSIWYYINSCRNFILISTTISVTIYNSNYAIDCIGCIYVIIIIISTSATIIVVIITTTSSIVITTNGQ